MKSLLAIILASQAMLFAGFTVPNQLGLSSFEPWYFMGGDETHVISSASEEGIVNLVDGEDTCPGEAWKYGSRFPNCNDVSSAQYISDYFTIEGNHEIEFTFSINCVNEDNTLNFKSKNNLDDIDLYVYDASNNNQLMSLRIWFDSGGYDCGNHSYQLGAGNDYPNKYSGSNWINGDAKLSSSFYINFSKEYLFRSYVNKWAEPLTRLDNTSNAFYNAAKSYVEGVSKVYFVIKGDGGWAKQATVILRSIGGQSLSTISGNIEDTVAPDIYETTTISHTIEKNVEYTIPVKSVDLLSTVETKYYYDGNLLTSNKVTPTELGDHVIKVAAIDGHENQSEKEYQVTVTGELVPPTITSLPTIEDQTIKEGETFVCDLPTYEDETATATISAVMECGIDSYVLIFDNENNKFYIEIDDSFVSGEYRVIFTVTNIVGSVESSPITFELTIVKVPKPDFVTYDEGITVRYVDEGILVHSIGRWRKTNFGVFDIRYGIDAYFTIPILSSNGQKNTAAYFDMQILNVENPNYWIMYRIWLDEMFLTNDSSPTNMYFNFGTPGNSQCVDLGDCGWLTRSVDDIDGKFHFNYNVNDGFSGEFRKTLIQAQGSQGLTSRFFDEAGSNNFYVMFYVASRDGGVGDNQNSEFIMNELNNQRFENENGVIDVVTRPNVVIGSIEDVYLANGSSQINMYVKDILNLHPTYNARFTNEDGGVVKEDTFTSSPFNLSFPDAGIYKLKLFTINKKGKEVGKTFDIEVRSSVDPIVITVEGTYETSYLPGESVTILSATYSSNVLTDETRISLIKGSKKRDVEVGDTITFDKAGMYIIEYYACDNAYPHHNELAKRSYLNVLDVVNPVIDINLKGSLRAEEDVTIQVQITDDTECDTAIIITDTNGYKTTFFGTEASFVPEQQGEYKLTVRCEDSYSNISIKTMSINIAKKAPNKTLISWIVIGVIVLSVLASFIILSSYLKVRERKGVIK